ncbi:class II aldolase/adducin family protein [Muricauda sp. 2012CJ35-5]|uniref:Class II aldolase/adducin family protein n=1 Tax=Flagellimonas spongiicola TaxID=2942208 RepID=A0ABT0PSU6_9FLAO|nr:class II aldolase/adducin family protein [Allomuricauda spongiicola]MCL6274281.1 class II aldolase/adducin family protein [Allomuricauda spongiicola]
MNTDNALSKLIAMSKYAGQRFDLVQAGGGNTSVKEGDKMFIKASGYLLSELTLENGYSIVDTQGVLSILENPEILEIKDKREKDTMASIQLQKTKTEVGPRPSIETYLHALLYKYTLHVHSIAVNMLTSRMDWERVIGEIFPSALCVRYETPGIELAVELKNLMDDYKAENGHLPNIIFLQNHGLIISSDRYEDIVILNEEVILAAEKANSIDFSRFRNTTKIAQIYNEIFQKDIIAYLSEDQTIYKSLSHLNQSRNQRPFSPDGYVFCGYCILTITNLSKEEFNGYYTKYQEAPKVLIYNDLIYILAADLKKAKMIEDVLKNNLIIESKLGQDLQFLEVEEIKYLGNWEAEKYRQKL